MTHAISFQAIRKEVNFSIESTIFVLTWAVVSSFLLFFMFTNPNFGAGRFAITCTAFVAYSSLWFLSTRQDSELFSHSLRAKLFLLQFFVILGIYFLVPWTFSAIFMIMWVAILPYFVSTKTAFILSPIWSVPLWLIYTYYWDQSYAFVTAVLYWTFSLFALVMVNTAKREKETREKAEQINRELVSTQHLLSQATQQAERVRIARNIHDLLGHHLTALTINLQVASRKTDRVNSALENDELTEVKAAIEQSHSLATLLLSDVREAVSDIRDKSKIDLKAALLALTENLPNLKIDLNIDEELNIDNVGLADGIIKTIQECITNTMKHGQADKMEIKLQQEANSLSINVKDNGKATPETQVKLGNGLLGIRERIEAFAGSVEFMAENGFTTHITLPLVTDYNKIEQGRLTHE